MDVYRVSPRLLLKKYSVIIKEHENLGIISFTVSEFRPSLFYKLVIILKPHPVLRSWGSTVGTSTQ